MKCLIFFACIVLSNAMPPKFIFLVPVPKGGLNQLMPSGQQQAQQPMGNLIHLSMPGQYPATPVTTAKELLTVQDTSNFADKSLNPQAESALPQKIVEQVKEAEEHTEDALNPFFEPTITSHKFLDLLIKAITSLHKTKSASVQPNLAVDTVQGVGAPIKDTTHTVVESDLFPRKIVDPIPELVVPIKDTSNNIIRTAAIPNEIAATVQEAVMMTEQKPDSTAESTIFSSAITSANQESGALAVETNAPFIEPATVAKQEPISNLVDPRFQSHFYPQDTHAISQAKIAHFAAVANALDRRSVLNNKARVTIKTITQNKAGGGRNIFKTEFSTVGDTNAKVNVVPDLATVATNIVAS